MPVLRASFVRTAGQRDRVYVVRPDGSEVSWVFPTYGDMLPHDFVHLVVEAAAGLRDGFWGRVAAGVDPARVNAMADGAAGKLADKYAGFGADLRELVVAEALAAFPWRPADGRDEAVAHWTSQFRDVPVPEPAVVARVAAILEAQTARWRGLLPKGAIDAIFDPVDPRRGLDAMV